MQFIALAFVLPIVFKFGVEKGRVYMIIIAVALLAALIGLMPLLDGVMSSGQTIIAICVACATLLPLEELDNYLKGDKLIKVLIDKDCRIKRDIVPTDIDYHVRKPSAREYDDCCNEFWNVTPYVIKGLCRKEILFAIDLFNQIVRHDLLRMISWKYVIETGFKLSVGK